MSLLQNPSIDKFESMCLDEFLNSSPIQYGELLKAISELKCPQTLRCTLKTIASRLPKVDSFKMNVNPYESNIDYVSLLILRKSALPYGYKIPLTSEADGNCLFHSVSLLLAQDLSLSLEIKVINFSTGF